MKNKKTKIVMMSMFRNEAKTIGRMLESCYKYIDYYVLQDNGSTDGTPEVVANFFKDKNIPGFVYKVEEGWVGFGWNRDHLVQTVQKTNHGCDWILKMDCDEVLVVDDDLDWSVFDDTSIQAFHVPAVADNCLYHRAWMYNSKFPWRFNHDTAHETVYMDIEGIKENFQCVNLPYGFRQIGYTDGQSYGVKTKYITDSLKLEEKLIREETMLTDYYHFWYIGKSYYDSFRSDFYPLKRKHSEEFARRTIFYFKEWINHAHKTYEETGKPERIDEMAYYALMCIGLVYRFLNNTPAAIKSLLDASDFSPPRNEHYMRLAEIYYSENMFKELFDITELMLKSDRKNPFPLYNFIIETDAYYDTGSKIKELNQYAREKLNIIEDKKPIETNLYNIRINQNMKKRLFVVDNFYENGADIRKFALSLEFKQDLRWYKGLRSTLTFRPPSIKEAFEKIIGEKIQVWDEHAFNGCFQITTAEDPQVYHHDVQKWAGMIYLSPDAPLESGTRLHRSKISGARHADESGIDTAFSGGFYDSTKFDTVDSAGNIYNRLVIMDARCIHSAGTYFGNNNTTGRLIHLFFFD
jgi:glycosyltransferase involved in cell wall biosynthesis